MRRVLLGLACALGLALSAGAAQAHGYHGHVSGAAYYHNHGVAFSGGWYYPGYHHNHWSHCVWNARYGRYHYFDPYLRCWYYWNAPGNCYYPVPYAP